MENRSYYDAEEVVLRHIKQAFGAVPTGATAVSVLGFNYYAVPGAYGGINGLEGQQGFTSGRYTRAIGQPGEATISLPNAEGPDGVLHRNRFDIITRGRSSSLGGAATTYLPGSYRPGDEWIEVWPARDGRRIGTEPKFVGTPTGAQVTATSIELTLTDRWGWSLGDRETTLGYWCAAPSSVIRNYQGVWQAFRADGFEDSATYISDATTRTSANGQWSYTRVGPSPNTPGAVRLDGSVAGYDGNIWATAPLITSSTTSDRWWMQATVRVSPPAGQSVGGRWLNLQDVNQNFRLSLAARSDGRWGYYVEGGTLNSHATTQVVPNSGRVTLRIEQAGKWLYFMGDGQVIDVLPYLGGLSITPRIYISTGNGLGTADLTEFTVGVRKPLFASGSADADFGDMHLPANLQPGGLLGKYYSIAQWSTKTTAEILARALNPTNEPVEERIDAQVAFPTQTIGTWQPPRFLNAEYFAAKWTGAIYLDLANYNYKLRLDIVGVGRLQLGRFVDGEYIINAWTTDQIQNVASVDVRGPGAQIEKSISGWYPIKIEYANLTGSSGLQLKYERSDAIGTFTVVPPSMLSTQGVFDDLVRLESHHDMFQKVASFAGLQVTCEPRSLESPGFPGQIIPRARLGRDVDYQLTEEEATGAQLSVDANDVADLIVADAVGLADPKNAAQITAQAMNRKEAVKHAQMRQIYLSIADVTDTNVASQQLEQQVYLASSPWEEVAAGADGTSLLVDAFPLPVTPNRQTFGWEPGDAPRLKLPSIGVMDSYGRQLMGVEWPFSPNGFARPNATWRARPRNDIAILRTIYQAALNPKRNYQGQLIALTGQIARSSSGLYSDLSDSSYGITTNTKSQVALPPRATIYTAHVVVTTMSAVPSAANFTITMNGAATGWLINRPGQYDVTAWALEQNLGLRSFYSQLTGGGGTVYTQQLVVIAVI